MTDRDFDIVIWGATGFTGHLVAEYLMRHGGDDLRLAIAGRDEAKLERTRARLGGAGRGPASKDRKLPILLGDSFDAASLDAIASRTKVVCSTVGPYAKYGSEMVAACARAGTDYCDITGEPHFVRRMADAHHEEAEDSGARIVHCCGYDSIPSDLGTLMMQDAMHERHGVHAQEVKCFAGETKGYASGGTVASILNLLDEAKRDSKVRRTIGNPYGLDPEGTPRGPDGPDQRGVRFDDDLGMWTAPFLMAVINTRIVRRSHALLGQPWGRGFAYSEMMSTGKGPGGLARATAVTGGMGAVAVAGSSAGARRLFKRYLPSPGDGPTVAQREAGYFRTRLIAKAKVDGRDVTLRGLVAGVQDPGYGETSKMLGESALCLALDEPKPGLHGGVLTPASAMGMRLVERLRDAGMTFEIQ